MPAVHLQYAQELWNKFGYLAAWLPNEHLSLGDVGIVRDGIFEPITSLARLDIAFDVEPAGGVSELSYTSSDKVTVETNGGVQGGVATAVGASAGHVTVNFGSEKSVLFQASGSKVSRIADLQSLGNAIIKRSQQDLWGRRHVVVSDLITVEAATILVSNGKNARIELDVEGELTPTIASLGKANVKLGVRYSAGIDTRILCEGGLTPLFKVAGIRGNWLRPDEFARREARVPPTFAEISYEELLSNDWSERVS